jgi:two-component SAPR family response regulator
MSKKKRQEKKKTARKAVVKEKLFRKREKAAAEAKLAKLLAQLRKEMSNDEPRSADTSTEGDFLGGSYSPTENRADV